MAQASSETIGNLPVMDENSDVEVGVVFLKERKRDVHRLKLDPTTAHQLLSLYKNNRMVILRDRRESPYYDHPNRFEEYPQVLCTESLPERCYWEVEWTGRVSIAVTYMGISRKGNRISELGRNDNSWTLNCVSERGIYSVMHNGQMTILPVRASSVAYRVYHNHRPIAKESRFGNPVYTGRVAVYLDQPAGTLSFYDVSSSSDTLTHLYTFQDTFTEPLYAGFRVFEGFKHYDDCTVYLCESTLDCVDTGSITW